MPDAIFLLQDFFDVSDAAAAAMICYYVMPL